MVRILPTGSQCGAHPTSFGQRRDPLGEGQIQGDGPGDVVSTTRSEANDGFDARGVRKRLLEVNLRGPWISVKMLFRNI